MTSASTQRVAVVTGGSSGIGLATVVTLLEGGHRAAFFGQTRDRVVAAEEELAARFGTERVFARKVDLSMPHEVSDFFGALEHVWALPDILICNAGVSPKCQNGPTPFTEIALEEWHSVLAVNLTGTMLCCKAALPSMVHRGFGRIVLIGSIAGRTIPRVAGTAYVASKSALAGLARSLVATSAGRGVTVNVVAPGLIATNMVGPLESAANKAAIGRIPIGRAGTPEDVAAAIEFLVSERAGFINGAILDINGGEFAPL